MAPGDTAEPGDSRITTIIALCGRKPAGGAKKRLTHALCMLHSRDGPPPTPPVLKQRHMQVLKRTCTRNHAHIPPRSPPPPPPRSHSCLIKSISCASAVPRQMTFKQVLLVGGEQMGGGRNWVYLERLNLASVKSQLQNPSGVWGGRRSQQSEEFCLMFWRFVLNLFAL